MKQNQTRQNKTRRREWETSFWFSLLAFLPLPGKKKKEKKNKTTTTREAARDGGRTAKITCGCTRL